MRTHSFKQVVCGVAVAAVCGSASAASSSTETIDLGLVAAGTTKSFNRAVVEGPTPIGFSDWILFDLPANGGSAYSVVDFPVTALNLGLTFASLSLWSAGADGAVGGSGANADTLISQVGGVVGEEKTSFSMTIGTQPPGKMFLFVSGFTTGSGGGLYNGSVAVFPVPVPEPETWAMMLIGAGLVGFRLRKQSKKAAALRLA